MKSALKAIAALALAGVTLGLAAAPALAQTYGSVQIGPGFTPDPRSRDLQAGGGINANGFGGNCVGWIADAPDYSVFWGGGSNLIISSVSSADTTLVVRTPAGNIICDDDSGEGLNPAIGFTNATGGRYDIWVGTLSGGLAPAQLRISELYSY